MRALRATLAALAVAVTLLVAPAPAQAASWPKPVSLLCFRKLPRQPVFQPVYEPTYTDVVPRRRMCPQAPIPRRR